MHRLTPCIRSVLGDIALETRTACNAHEHLSITGPHIRKHYPDFLLDDPQAIAGDVADFLAAGGNWIVDTMPTGPARSGAHLMTISRLSGVAIICPTGVHLPQYYPHDHPLLSMNRDQLTALFCREIEHTITDEGDHPHPGCRAGIIKVAGGRDQLSEHQREAFAAAGMAAAKTGAPIITHTEQGTAAMAQVDLLLAAGADPHHIALSHVDRNPDIGLHRALLETGVSLEYDNHFRTILKGQGCPTADLIAALIEDFPRQIVVGMDIARRSNWTCFGGRPGMSWLLHELPVILRQRGVQQARIDDILIHNPAHIYALSDAAT